ncbi:MAG TPA: hypothetical protein O0X27_00705, partial [Methanocorpusculum sp.]|nr:hypothetical protein [Methanocorpusculum sp.]
KKALRKEERRSKNLRTKLDQMKRYIALTAGDGCLALKVLPLLSRDAIRTMDDEMGVCEDDILYILKIDGWGRTAIHDIADAQVRAVILPKQTFSKARHQNLIDEFRELNIPIFSGEALSPRVKGKIGVVDEPAFIQAEAEWKLSQDVYLKEKHTHELNGMVAAYQVQRRRDVQNLGIDPSSLAYAEPEDQPARVPEVPSVKVVKEPVVEQPVRVPVVESAAVEKKPPVEKKSPAEPKSAPVEPEKDSGKPDILTSVLQTYRKERQKELKRK